jgi:hypothetical protein
MYRPKIEPLNIDMARKNQSLPKKQERLKMKGITVRLLPNIARLKIDIAKNSNISLVNENSLSRLDFLQ